MAGVHPPFGGGTVIDRVTPNNIELLANKYRGDVVNQVTPGGVVPRIVFGRRDNVVNIGDLIGNTEGGGVIAHREGSHQWEVVA
nr:MAG TPA: hypothetical protein [Caudoviricetes sp.]